MKFELFPDKIKARDLTPDVDHIMVGDMLWRVIRTTRSIDNPNWMLTLAFHTHTEPQSYKFHPVRDADRFDVFRPID